MSLPLLLAALLSAQEPVPVTDVVVSLSPEGVDGGEPVTVSLAGPYDVFELPSCEGALARVAVLPPDAFDGVRRLVFPESRNTVCGNGLPSFVNPAQSEAATVQSCGAYRVRLAPPGTKATHPSAPIPPARTRPLLLRARLLSIEEAGESTLLDQTVPLVPSQALELTATTSSDLTLWIGGAVVARREQGLDLALGVTLYVQASPARETPSGRSTLDQTSPASRLVAHQDGFLTSPFGEATRGILVASDGYGKPTITLELTVTDR